MAFPTTRWSLILAAQDSAQRDVALRELLAVYWMPLYHFVRRKGRGPDDARDAVQGVVLHLLEQDFLDTLDPERGRLRAFLATATDHYLSNLHEKASAQKRGGHLQKVTMDFDFAEAALANAPLDPAAAYEREWARSLMSHCTARLRAEYDSGARSGPFELVSKFFSDDPPSYKDAAAEFRMTVPQVTSFLHRARTRFREIVREEVAHTVADPNETGIEIEEILGTR